MPEIRVNSLNKLLTVYEQVQRYGPVFSVREIAAMIGCTPRHAYNYKYAVEEILRLQRRPRTILLNHLEQYSRA
jgi:hypothetical protein